jgi:general secretion pathway protein M
MKEWLNGLEPRERRLVLTGAALASVLLMYVLVWEPFAATVERLRVSGSEQQAVLLWMEGAAKEVKQLSRGARRPGQAATGQSLLALIDSTAKAGRLGTALKRVQPDGEQRVQVWLEEAAFDDVAAWLEGLNQRQGITLESSVIAAKDKPGLVDVRLVFAGDGA